jgi:hypothetical protein
VSDERWQRQLRNDVEDLYEFSAGLAATVRRLEERLDRMESQQEELLDRMESRPRAVRPWARRIVAVAAAVAAVLSSAAVADDDAEIFDHHSIQA